MGEAILGNEGTLGVFVWPVYVGLSQGTPDPTCSGEPFLNPDYKRGQITWEPMPGGEIIGRAEICVPAGTYDHLTYHYGPSIWPAGPQLMGHRQLDHPLCFTTVAVVAVDPINQGDWVDKPRWERLTLPNLLT